MSAAAAGAAVAAAGDRTAGPFGLLIILVLVVVTVLLIRNMSGRLRRLPREFPPPTDDPAPAPTVEGPPAP